MTPEEEVAVKLHGLSLSGNTNVTLYHYNTVHGDEMVYMYTHMYMYVIIVVIINFCLLEQEESRGSAAMLSTASPGTCTLIICYYYNCDTHSGEEGKPDHSLEDIKIKLMFGSPHSLFYELEDIMRPHHFRHRFMELIHTHDEYAELRFKVEYYPDILMMYRDTIWNCQSYSEVKKTCNLFLEVMGYAYTHRHHHRDSELHYVAHELKKEWERVLGGEPLVDIDKVFFFL